MMRIHLALASIVVLVVILACSITSPVFPGNQSPTFTPISALPFSGPGESIQKTYDANEVQTFMDQASMEKRVPDLLAWGGQQGFISSNPIPSGGGSVTYSDGTTVSGVMLDKVMLLKFTTLGSTLPAYYLARVSGSQTDPVLELFDQEGRAEFTKDGVRIYDQSPSASILNPTGISLISYQPLRSIQQVAKCEPSTNWHKFVKCLDSYGGSKFVASGICAVALYAVYPACTAGAAATAGGSCIAAIGVATASCGLTYGACIVHSLIDDSPEISLSMWTDTNKTAWVGTDVFQTENGPEIKPGDWMKLTIWKARITITDDRSPAPSVIPAADWIEAASGMTVQVDATDCGGNHVSETYRAPNLSETELNTFTNVNPNATEISKLPPAPPVPAAVEKTYTGKVGHFSSTDNGPWECREKDLTLVTNTYLFPGDGTMIWEKMNGDVLQGIYRWVYQQDVTNSQVYYHISTDTSNGNVWHEKIEFSDDTALMTEDFYHGEDGKTGQCQWVLTQVNN
jgi:hypothetical protein